MKKLISSRLRIALAGLMSLAAIGLGLAYSKATKSDQTLKAKVDQQTIAERGVDCIGT